MRPSSLDDGIPNYERSDDDTIEANRIDAGTVHAERADGESVETLSGGGMLPVLVVLVVAGGALTLVGYARYRGWADL